MMNRTLPLALALAALAPSVASANNVITDSQVRFEEDVIELRIEASETLTEPRVRTAPGFVRIWFEDTRAARVDRDGDGSSLRFVHIRPGVDESTVVIVRLMDMRRLPLEAVTVQRDGQVVRVRISRAALGLSTPVAPTPTPEAETETETEAEVEETPEEVAPAAEAPVEPAPTTPLFSSEETDSPARPLVIEEGPSMITVLAFLLLLLGGAYLGLSIWKSKRPGNRRHRAIEMIAQKRVGVRHQLVVVRALGQDHLLAVHSGRTDHIASVATPEDDSTTIDLDAPPSELLPYLRLSSIPPKKGDETRVALRSERGEGVEDRPRFGAELMRAAAQRTVRDSVSLASVGATSDTINGLLRLREKLGR